MKVEKKKIADLTLCYCVAPLTVDGEPHYLVASEKEHECFLFDLEGNQVDKIWDGPGGTMSAVQVPGVDAAFLATHRFYSPNNCKEATIILCRHEGSEWTVRTLAALPGVHRFDILTRNGVNYLLACTIKTDYEYKDDWRFPGKVFACRLPDDLMNLPEDYTLPMEVLRENVLKNHGYSKDICNGVETGIVTSNEGVFRFTPPAAEGEAWGVEQLIDDATSDAILCDFDGDGEKEMLTLSPFHGDTMRVYKCMDGKFTQVFEYEKKIEFAHAICSAALNGQEIAIIGYRKGDRDLLAVRYENGGYVVTVLDHDVGPANARSYSYNGKTIVLSANREINEIARYELTED